MAKTFVFWFFICIESMARGVGDGAGRRGSSHFVIKRRNSTLRRIDQRSSTQINSNIMQFNNAAVLRSQYNLSGLNYWWGPQPPLHIILLLELSTNHREVSQYPENEGSYRGLLFVESTINNLLRHFQTQLVVVNLGRLCTKIITKDWFS